MTASADARSAFAHTCAFGCIDGSLVLHHEKDVDLALEHLSRDRRNDFNCGALAGRSSCGEDRAPAIGNDRAEFGMAGRSQKSARRSQGVSQTVATQFHRLGLVRILFPTRPGDLAPAAVQRLREQESRPPRSRLSQAKSPERRNTEAKRALGGALPG